MEFQKVLEKSKIILGFSSSTTRWPSTKALPAFETFFTLKGLRDKRLVNLVTQQASSLNAPIQLSQGQTNERMDIMCKTYDHLFGRYLAGQNEDKTFLSSPMIHSAR